MYSFPLLALLFGFASPAPLLCGNGSFLISGPMRHWLQNAIQSRVNFTKSRDESNKHLKN